LGKIESTIKAEIERLAKQEVKVVFRPLRKEVWGMRLKLSNLLKVCSNESLGKGNIGKQGQGTQIGGLPRGSEGFAFHPGKDSAS
jgi:hypothetical protein